MERALVFKSGIQCSPAITTGAITIILNFDIGSKLQKFYLRLDFYTDFVASINLPGQQYPMRPFKSVLIVFANNFVIYNKFSRLSRTKPY